MDVFFALSHGVHRGKLKSRNYDDRETFINKLIDSTSCMNLGNTQYFKNTKEFEIYQSSLIH